MRKMLVAICLFLASLGMSGEAPPAVATDRPELERLSLVRGMSMAELSGFAIDASGKLLTVTDEPSEHFVFEVSVRPSKDRFELKPLMDFTKLAGWVGYVAEASGQTFLKDPSRILDLEGITRCGETLYLANERVRQVMVLDREAASIRRLAIDWRSHPEVFQGGDNAGWEGLTIDCASKIAYVVKERSPRGVYAVSLETGKVLWNRDIPTSDRCCARVLEWTAGNGLVTLKPDFSDVLFENGFLYLIERNTYEVTKVDVARWKVVARVSYFKTEKDLYTTGEPFGLAEALALRSGEIIIGFDNNTAPFSPMAEYYSGFKGREGALAVFKRPAGF
jgi:hypothetical protein